MSRTETKDITLDLSEETLEINAKPQIKASRATRSIKEQSSEDTVEPLISCLGNEVITVQYIKKDNGVITNPKHVLYGGLAETAIITLTVPKLTSGAFKNVLTNSEKAFLEEIMGLGSGALSVYRAVDNYWKNLFVRLGKDDTYLNLAVPEDYIKYKVLLANSDIVAPNLKALSNKPKETYRFVLVSENEEIAEANENMTLAMEASLELGKLLNDKAALKLVVEIVEGKPIASSSKLDFIKSQAFKCMQSNPKLFVSIAKDPYLQTKVFIKECLEYGLIRKRGEYYYNVENNSPLCEVNEEPVLDVAARYLNSPKRQEVKLMLEAKLKNLRE